MNTQVCLLNLLVPLVGWGNSELVGSMGNTEQMMFNSVHNVEIPSEMSYLLFISSPCQNRRMAECSLPQSQELCLEIRFLTRITESHNHRMFANKNSFSCQSNLPFCIYKIQPKPNHGLPQASHGKRNESGKQSLTAWSEYSKGLKTSGSDEKTWLEIKFVLIGKKSTKHTIQSNMKSYENCK